MLWGSEVGTFLNDPFYPMTHFFPLQRSQVEDILCHWPVCEFAVIK